jgi:PST family polysaccharide transporter
MSKPSLTTRTLLGLLWSAFGKGGHMALGIVVMMVLARFLTPSQYGVVGAASILVSFSQIFSQIGIGPALVQRPRINSSHIHVGFTLSLGMGLFVGIIFYHIAPLTALFFHMTEVEQVVRVFSIIFPLTSLGVVAESLIQREMQFKKLAMIDISSYAISYGIVGIGLAFYGLGIWALVVAQIAQALLKVIILLSLRKDAIGFAVDYNISKQLINYGIGFSLAKVSNFFAIQADNIVAGRWLGANALGIYGRAYQFLMMPTNLFGEVVDKALFPALASVQDNKDRLGRAYLKAVAALIMLSLPLSVFLIVLAPEIIFIVLGTKWMGVVLPFQILASVLVFRSGYKISDSIARATGAVYRRAWRQILYAAAAFSGAWVGCHWGIAGLAVGVACAITLNYFLMLHLSAGLTGISFRALLTIYARYMAVGAGIAGITLSVAILSRIRGWHSLVTLSLSSMAVLVFIGALLIFFRSIFGEEGRWLYSLIQKDILPLMRRGSVRNANDCTTAANQ